LNVSDQPLRILSGIAVLFLLFDAAMKVFKLSAAVDGTVQLGYGDVPNKRCVRVRQGGEVLQAINLDRGCFACMLGGSGKSTLFLIATEWRGMQKIPEVAQARTGQILAIAAPAPGAGRPQNAEFADTSQACRVRAVGSDYTMNAPPGAHPRSRSCQVRRRSPPTSGSTATPKKP
jgi:hypothetical protein